MDYFELREQLGITHLPDLLAPYYQPRPAAPLIDRGALSELLKLGELNGEAETRILRALDEIERDERLCSFTGFVIEQTCLQRERLDPEHIALTDCAALSEASRAFYPLLVLLACVPLSLRRVRARGVPEQAALPIVEKMTKELLHRYGKTGNPAVSFAWSANFMTCSIFLFDRFYLIPHPFSADFTIFQNEKTGEVCALMKEGVRVRRDGQYDGVSGVFDTETFATVRADTEQAFFGHRVSPIGAVCSRPVQLPRSEWRQAVLPGQAFLALHIPGGPGYTPERLRSSLQQGLAFYDTYFPELSVRGIWSESWLYDPHLRLVLDGQSGIIQMQNQMYCAPFAHGHASIHGELHSKQGGKTSLEQAVEAYEAAGGTFASCYMFILREDVERIGGPSLYGGLTDADEFIEANRPQAKR